MVFPVYRYSVASCGNILMCFLLRDSFGVTRKTRNTSARSAVSWFRFCLTMSYFQETLKARKHFHTVWLLHVQQRSDRPSELNSGNGFCFVSIIQDFDVFWLLGSSSEGASTMCLRGGAVSWGTALLPEGAGLIPSEIIRFFTIDLTLQAAVGLEVDSASKRNEYRGSSLGWGG
jgi:hypothetical protein